MGGGLRRSMERGILEGFAQALAAGKNAVVPLVIAACCNQQWN
jgi:hypothetical protein